MYYNVGYVLPPILAVSFLAWDATQAGSLVEAALFVVSFLMGGVLSALWFNDRMIEQNRKYMAENQAICEQHLDYLKKSGSDWSHLVRSVIPTLLRRRGPRRRRTFHNKRKAD